MAFQLVQIALAVGVVGAFASLQLGMTRPQDVRYLAVNLVSAAGLTVTAVLAFQLGFVITNALWVAVSSAGLIRVWRAPRAERGGFEPPSPENPD